MRWICNECEATFDNPVELEPWKYSCPWCGNSDVEELDSCPSCHRYKRKGEVVCIKCQLRTRDEFRRFLRGLDPSEIAYLDDITDGTALSEFR